MLPRSLLVQIWGIRLPVNTLDGWYRRMSIRTLRLRMLNSMIIAEQAFFPLTSGLLCAPKFIRRIVLRSMLCVGTRNHFGFNTSICACIDADFDLLALFDLVWLIWRQMTRLILLTLNIKPIRSCMMRYSLFTLQWPHLATMVPIVLVGEPVVICLNVSIRRPRLWLFRINSSGFGFLLKWFCLIRGSLRLDCRSSILDRASS